MKIVFLDIDGVLQPYDSEYRFYEKDNQLIDKLSQKYNTDYYQYSFYDLSAVYYDWNKQAISRLKYILNETQSKIIISSDWRNINYPNKMKDLLKIHNLDNYYFADNIIINDANSLHEKRSKEINYSLNKYDIDNFVIIDDMKKLEEYFKDNIVITNNIIGINDMNKAIKILKK